MEPSFNVNDNGCVLRNETSNAIVHYHLNKLLASHLGKSPQEIAESSKSAAAAATAAAAAAKAARANANAKAYAAAKAVAAAKAALSLIASFPKHVVVAEAEAEAEVDEEGDVVLQEQEVLPSVDAMTVSSPSCEGKKNEEWSTGRLRGRPNTEVGSSGRVVVDDSVSGQGGAKEDVQKPTRKRGRPRKH